MVTKIPKKGKNPGSVDSWLDTLGFYRKNVAYDETCLFRAVSEQLFDCQVYHERVRKECLEYARKNFDEFKFLDLNGNYWAEHLNKLEKHMVVCGNLELNIISKKYQRDVHIFDASNQVIKTLTNYGFENPLSLCLMDEDHYDVIYKKEHIATAGYCQSIVYKLLYEDVFHIPNVDEIVNSMLYDKSNIILPMAMDPNESNEGKKENNTSNEPCEFDQNPTNIAPFPFKVAKALDPTIYRNIEYDSWGEVRREFRLGDWYYGDDKLILGTRCILNDTIQNEQYECYIQEIIKDQNKCVVYLIKLAEKRTVDYTNLSPENDAKPWPLPYRFSKNLVIGPTPLSVPEKNSKNLKKRNKDKRRSKSCSESSALSNNLNNPDTNDNVNPFVGIPLQMQNHNDTTAFRSSNENENSSESPEVSLSPESEPPPDVAPQNIRFPQWEATQQWHPYLTPTPDPFMWQPTPTTPQNVFNFAMKPMMTSTPCTPDVMSYYDPNYVYYYNYHNYDPCNYQVWSEYNTQQSTEALERHEEPRKDSNTDINHNEKPMEHSTPEHHPQEHHAPPERPPPLNMSLAAPPQMMEMYSPMIPIPPGTPILYAPAPEMPEMMIPTTPYTVFTPPVDVQYVSPGPFVYPPTPPAAWYPSHPINSQGFIFPTVPPPMQPQQTAGQK
ncbi:unnamed protein product [Brassicogethes aeneus]|uniref:OTU domain-containing protein n=1 Tax=Brassicogethes aeneus TaxID=1431903 RepID=A0A9P0FEB3_BRAAE|nr:unnamed protein product [Brassicogethes aeneus]